MLIDSTKFIEWLEEQKKDSEAYLNVLKRDEDFKACLDEKAAMDTYDCIINQITTYPYEHEWAIDNESCYTE